MSFLLRPSRQVIVGSLLILIAIVSPVEAAQLQLTWTDNSTDEDGFKIERSTAPTGTFVQIAVTGPDVTSYTDSGLANATTYCYRVRAFNAAGDSDYSDVACSTTLQTFSLVVVRAGTGGGTVTGSPSGISCGATCSASYASGTAVTLTATPATDSTFTGWSGGGCSGTSSCSVAMSAVTTVTATFDVATSALTVTKAGAGSGTVTSMPAGIMCGTTCSATYPGGTAVTLTATPATGSTFTGWSGGGCSGTGSCTVTMSAATTVTGTFSVPVTLNPITSDRPSPQDVGTPITFSANATGGITPYQYKWWLWNGNAWTVVQDWSASATFAWRPTTANAGYEVIAWVRSAGNTADLFEDYKRLAFPITPPAPASMTGITADKPSPQGPGVTITFTASASGGTTPYQYKWWLWNGSAWNIVQDWSPSATFVWRPTMPNAAHELIAWVRSAGNTVDLFEDYKRLPFPIRPATLTVTADRVAPATVGTTITFTAAGSGGTGPYQFKWWLWNGSAWNVVQDWSPSATFVWTPAVANPNYQLIAWIRSAGDTADLFESYAQLAFAINPPPPATLTGITADKPSPQGPGVTITFTTSASGGTAPYQYKWWLWNGSAWNIVQDWSPSATFVWRPTMPNAAHELIAWVRSAGNTVDLFEDYKRLPFPIRPATLTVTADRVAPATVGTTITFTAAGSGGTSPYQFKWWLWNGSAWNVVQDWSASATFVWSPTAANPGYQLIAWVRSAGDTADLFESYTQFAFAITGP